MEAKREDVADLFASDDGTVSLVFHDDCVYAYDRIGHMGAVESKDTDKVVIVKAELANGKTSEVFSYEGANNAINEARSFGDKLFFLINHNSIDKETLTADVNYKLYCYDYATGSAELVSDKNISDYYVDTDNGILYYFVIDKGLYSRKLNENDGKLLYKADDSIVMAPCHMMESTYICVTVVQEVQPRLLILLMKKYLYSIQTEHLSIL